MKLARHFAVIALLLASLTASGQRLIVAPTWRLTEMQPDIQEGGRADSIAVNPANNDIIIVATESGGLFRSTDRGQTWAHLNFFPTFWTRGMVSFVDANVVIATAVADFKTANGGGIYRSTDAGITWTQAVSPPPPATSPNALFEAREISVAIDTGYIYVATSYGVAKSIDRGATWTHSDPFGAAADRVQSVLALTNGVILAGGPTGLRRSTNHGANWILPSTNSGNAFHDGNTHAFSRSPYWSDHAYMVNGSNELYFSESGGDRWTRINSAPGGSGGCGGIAFVKARASTSGPRTLTLWYGDRCGLYTLSCPEVLPRSFNYGGMWSQKALDHGDTRDLAFDSAGRPLLLGTDGGLHNTADGGNTWRFVGGGRNGFNALQITEAKGQNVVDRNRYDLYFGTQDNKLWASGDAGVTWNNSVCCEGFYIEGEPRVQREADSKITAVACGACVNFITDPLFANSRNWPNAQTPHAGNPVILGQSLHVQGVDTRNGFSSGFGITANLGTNWAQYGTFPEQRLSIPRLSKPANIPVLYQAIRTGMTVNGTQIDKLVRVTWTGPAMAPTVTYPAMNNFGGLGVNPTMFAWYEVFGIDTADTRHLIAPDIINSKMMETFDAGNNWSEIPALTALVTDNGRYVFARKRDAVMHSNATVVSFNRDHPDIVAVGTMQGGILISRDRGVSWSRVSSSERATFITSIEWKSANEAVVSTYGRGLWRLTLRWRIPIAEHEKVCSKWCDGFSFIPAASGTPATVIQIFNGQVQGGTTSKGTLQELFVTPASSVVIYADDDAAAANVKITESSKFVGWSGTTAPKASEGSEMVGVTLTEGDGLLSGIFTADPLPMYTPTEKEQTQDKDPIGDPKSPTAGKPYLRLSLDAANTLLPAETLTVTGRDFPPLATVEITVDDQTVTKITTSDRGELSVKLTAPGTQGMHVVKVLDANRKIIDGATFLVGHNDEEKD